MSIRCAMSGCTNTKSGSGRIFVRCEKCGAWWCSKHGTQGNRCPGCDHKYLRGGGSSGSGCFVTTATLIALGNGENCSELNVFRDFRDHWISKQPNGKEIIEDYYRIAPIIVSKIDSCDNKTEIYQSIWDDSLGICLKLIEEEKFDAAQELYTETMMILKKQYIA